MNLKKTEESHSFPVSEERVNQKNLKKMGESNSLSEERLGVNQKYQKKTGESKNLSEEQVNQERVNHNYPLNIMEETTCRSAVGRALALGPWAL
jgi:hypothetical protein